MSDKSWGCGLDSDLHQSRILVMTFLVHRLQLWREMLDGLASEAQRLRHMLGLPENRNWGETQHELDSSEYIQLLS